MFGINFKFLFVVFFILFFGYLALPQFQFKVGDKTIDVKGLDFTSFDPSSTLGNFQRSTGISDSKEYAAEISFASDTKSTDDDKQKVFENILQIVKNRADFSNLYDVDVTGSIVDGKYFINITFPSYYLDSESLATYLTGQGEISFTSSDTSTPLSLSDKDITGAIVYRYDEQYGNVLQFKFIDSKSLELRTAESTSQGYFLMKVDGTFFAVVGNQNLPNTVEAIPYAQLSSSANVATYANIVKSYFISQPLDHILTIDPANTKTVKREYIQESVTFAGIAFIISAILMALITLVKMGTRKTIKFILMLTSFVTFTIVLLKLQNAVLSISSIIGFIIIYAVSTAVIWHLIGVREDEIKANLVRFRDFSIALIVIMLLALRTLPANAQDLDMFGVILIGAITSFIMTLVNYRFILGFDLENLKISLPFRRNKNVK